MKFYRILFLLSVLNILFIIHSSLLTINYSNFHRLVKQPHSISFLLFVEKGCEKSKRIEETLSDIKSRLEAEDNNSILFGKINIYEENELAALYEIESFPTLLYINNRFDIYQSFSNVSALNSLYEFIKIKINPLEWNELTSKENLGNTSMVVCGQKQEFSEENIKAIETNVLKNSHISLFYINSQSMWNLFNCTSKIDIFFYLKWESKTLRYRYNNYNKNSNNLEIENSDSKNLDLNNQPSVNLQRLSKFIDYFVTPVISELTWEIINKSQYSEILNVVWIFKEKSNDNLNSIPQYSLFYDVAKESNAQSLSSFVNSENFNEFIDLNKVKKVNFYNSNLSNDFSSIILNQIKQSSIELNENTPKKAFIIAFKFSNGELETYLYNNTRMYLTDDMNSSSISSFIEDVNLNRKNSKYYLLKYDKNSLKNIDIINSIKKGIYSINILAYERLFYSESNASKTRPNYVLIYAFRFEKIQKVITNLLT